uniref:Uncharacterized protein n=1 Tax=Meloidogyne hapla TaxID=6305 RepID=A0A1I8BC82_MELHA
MPPHHQIQGPFHQQHTHLTQYFPEAVPQHLPINPYHGESSMPQIQNNEFNRNEIENEKVLVTQENIVQRIKEKALYKVIPYKEAELHCWYI